MASHRVLILFYPHGQVLDLVGPAQLFAAANQALGRPAYEVLLVGPARGPITCSAGFALHASLAYDEVTPALLAETGTIMATGGDRGLKAALEGGAIESIWLKDGNIWTSAGVTAGMDLALAMLEADHGRALALTLARHHVIFRVRPGGQRQYAAETAAGGCPEPRLAKLAAAVGEAPGADWRTERLAEAAHVSPRNLSRLFRRHLGASPADFVEQVRLDRARYLLLDGPAPVETVAQAAGFGSLRRMDRAFLRLVGTTPRDYRARFSSQEQPP